MRAAVKERSGSVEERLSGKVAGGMGLAFPGAGARGRAAPTAARKRIGQIKRGQEMNRKLTDTEITERLMKVQWVIYPLSDSDKREMLERVIDRYYYSDDEIAAALRLEGEDLTKRLTRAVAFALELTPGDTRRDIKDLNWFGKAEDK